MFSFLLDAGPLINVTLQVPIGLATVMTIAFVVYALKSIF